MSSRLTFGLGIGALMAAGVLAPQASAATQQLAPGVSCDDHTFRCRNDNAKDTYRVDAIVACSDVAGSVAGVAYVPAHGTAIIRYICPTVPGPKVMSPPSSTMQPNGTLQTAPPSWESGPPKISTAIGIRFQGAQVDNTPPPPTGSAG